MLNFHAEVSNFSLIYYQIVCIVIETQKLKNIDHVSIVASKSYPAILCGIY